MMDALLKSEIIRLASTGLGPKQIAKKLLERGSESKVVVITRPAQVVAFELKFKGLVAPSFMTNNKWNNSNESERDDKIAEELEKIMGAANVSDPDFIAASKTHARLNLLRSRIAILGGTATGAESGVSEVTNTVSVEVPSWFDQNMLGQRLPTVEEIRLVVNGG
jgi:hypothetical protein